MCWFKSHTGAFFDFFSEYTYIYLNRRQTSCSTNSEDVQIYYGDGHEAEGIVILGKLKKWVAFLDFYNEVTTLFVDEFIRLLELVQKDEDVIKQLRYCK